MATPVCYKINSFFRKQKKISEMRDVLTVSRNCSPFPITGSSRLLPMYGRNNPTICALYDAESQKLT